MGGRGSGSARGSQISFTKSGRLITSSDGKWEIHQQITSSGRKRSSEYSYTISQAYTGKSLHNGPAKVTYSTQADAEAAVRRLYNSEELKKYRFF